MNLSSDICLLDLVFFNLLQRPPSPGLLAFQGLLVPRDLDSTWLCPSNYSKPSAWRTYLQPSLNLLLSPTVLASLRSRISWNLGPHSSPLWLQQETLSVRNFLHLWTISYYLKSSGWSSCPFFTGPNPAPVKKDTSCRTFFSFCHLESSINQNHVCLLETRF